jgi:hypothetical protein
LSLKHVGTINEIEDFMHQIPIFFQYLLSFVRPLASYCDDHVFCLFLSCTKELPFENFLNMSKSVLLIYAHNILDGITRYFSHLHIFP